MTDTPDLELRKRMAMALGWTGLWKQDLGLPNRLIGTNPRGTHQSVVPPYELSVDACLRDALPVARERGYYLEIEELHISTDRDDEGHWRGSFVGPMITHARYGATPARAFVLAWLQLPEGETC